MIFLLGLLILSMSNANAGYIDKSHYVARSKEYIEPQTIKQRPSNDKCQIFCSDWHSPFYNKKVGGCFALDDLVTMEDYMFCPNISARKRWIKKDELGSEALFVEKALKNSDYQALIELMKQRDLRHSIHPRDNAGPLQYQDGQDFRRLTESNVIRRRKKFVVRPERFLCIGPRRGKKAKASNFARRPLKVDVFITRNLVAGLRFFYETRAGGQWCRLYGCEHVVRAGSYNNDFYEFKKLPHGCVTYVNLRGSSYGITGIRFGGLNNKRSQYYGSSFGTYHTLHGVKDRCLGDVRIWSDSMSVTNICLRFNAHLCRACPKNYIRKCPQYGEKKSECVIKKG